MESLPRIVVRPRRRSSSARVVHKRRPRNYSWLWNVPLGVMVTCFPIAVTFFVVPALVKSSRRSPHVTHITRKTPSLVSTKPNAPPQPRIPPKAVVANAINVEQFHSVPRGALRFRVEDVFGSPLQATHDVEMADSYGSNGEIFGGQLTNTFVLSYRVSDKPGTVAVFVFQGSSTNPPLVDKQLVSE
jgi:hypothetical protein